MGCDGPTDREKEGHSPPDDVDIVIKLDNTASTVKSHSYCHPLHLGLMPTCLGLHCVPVQEERNTPPHTVL